MSDFLSEIWGLKKLVIDESLGVEMSEEIAAVLLSANSDNFDRYICLDSFKKALETLGLRRDIYGVQSGQICAINSVIALKISIVGIKSALARLKDVQICKNYEQICDFLDSLKLIGKSSEGSLKFKKGEDLFHKNLDELNQIANLLAEISPEDALKKRIKNAVFTANNSLFKIVVTGVINAGKSSMLNSLMSSKVLGASNVPETACLSVLSYSKEPFAKVNFYDDAELALLGIDKHSDITSSQIDITPSELIKFTGATSSMSKYVKFVELGVNAQFLEQGTQIIDTPGLDDAVILREELTRRFMNEADFTLHLMNGAQSATKKDMSFIASMLCASKSSGFAIILTHADLLSDQELNEVINYTKKSIKNELQSYGYDENFSKKVEFFAVDSLSGRGISEVKDFIVTSFFGEGSQKAALILEGFKNEILLVAGEAKKALEFQNTLISSSNSKNLTLFESLQKNIDTLNEEFNKFTSYLENALSKFESFKLQSSLKQSLELLKDRVVSDLKYAKNSGKKPDISRICVIVASGFDDLFIDVFREYERDLYKKSKQLIATLALEFDFLKESGVDFKFNVKDFVAKRLSDISYMSLLDEVKALLQGRENLETIGQNLFGIFGKFLEECDVNSFFEIITKESFEYLKESLNSVLEGKKREFELKSTQIKASLENLSNSSDECEKLRAKIEQDSRTISEIYKRILRD